MSYHHGNLKDLLLSTCDEELKTLGYEKISLREVAKKAGVSHNAPYRHFKTKSDLIDQLIERELLNLSEQIQNASLLYQGSIINQLQFTARIWAQLATRHPKKAHLILTGLSSPHQPHATYAAAYQNIRLSIQGLLTQAMQNAELKLDSPCHHLAAIILGTIRGVAQLYTSQYDHNIISNEIELYELMDQAIENILRSHLA